MSGLSINGLVKLAVETALEHGLPTIRLRSGESEVEITVPVRGPEPEDFPEPDDTRIPRALRPFLADLTGDDNG